MLGTNPANDESPGNEARRAMLAALAAEQARQRGDR